MTSDIQRCVLIVAIVVIVAVVAGIISRSGLDWLYSDAVVRSPRMPQGWVFGIVWAIIYIAYAYVWCTASPSMDTIYAISIALNLLWVVVFFGAREVYFSRIVIVALALFVAFQAYERWQSQDTVGTLLMLVYLSWLLCATTINAETMLSRK